MTIHRSVTIHLDLILYTLILWNIIFAIMMFVALDYRIEQEQKICQQIPGADCSFLRLK